MGIISTVTRPWGLYVALALSAALFACVLVLVDKLNHAEVALLKLQGQVATERADAEHGALVLTQGYRDLEAGMTTVIRKADHDFQNERLSNQRTAAGFRTELDQLRVGAADYAAGGGASPMFPMPPAVNEPPPSGTYWSMVCEYRSNLLAMLKTMLPASEHCSPDGHQ